MYEQNDTSFMELCVKGQVALDEVDDFIEKWHHGEVASSISSYLGMTDGEYELFVLHPDALASIVIARRENRLLRGVVGAASSDEPLGATERKPA